MERYFLALFTRDSWGEFLNFGGNIYGTRLHHKYPNNKVQKNDYLICYITKISCFAGVLKIKSDFYIDKTPIWSKETFPMRFDVELIESTTVGNCVPVKEICKELSIFKNLKNSKKWSGFFMNSFTQFNQEDAKIIIDKIKNR